MKKFLLASVAIVLAAPALAADLPRRSQAVAPAYAAPVFTWAGLYIGAQAGYGWGSNKTNTLAPVNAYGVDSKGFLGGVHAGYNFQSGALVYGVEADLELSGVRGTRIPGPYIISDRHGFQGSLRARLGYSFDRALFYVTGGLAVADLKTRLIAAPGVENFSNTRAGWTLGAGVQYAIDNNWSVRAEYRYTDFGRNSVTSLVASPGTIISTKSTDSTVRVGVSYKFGGFGGPVVAKY